MLLQTGHALLTLNELLPQLDVTALPAPQRWGLLNSLGRLHAQIHLINQITDHQTYTPYAS